MSEKSPNISSKDAYDAISKLKNLIGSKQSYYANNSNGFVRLEIDNLKSVLNVFEQMNILFGQLMTHTDFQERVVHAIGKHQSELINPKNYESLEEFSAACKLFSIVPK